MNDQSHQIITFLLDELPEHPQDIVALAAKKFGVTRTTIHRHLTKLIKDNNVLKSGSTKSTSYYLSNSLNLELTYKISPEISEFEIFNKDFEKFFSKLADNLKIIFAYGFTEIFNNALDHSRGSRIIVKTDYENKSWILTISDDGMGIFKSIFSYFKLDDIRESVLQLNKGKMTTDPVRHSGEGIFFTSKVFDRFEIYANELYFLKDNLENDWSLSAHMPVKKGTSIIMTIGDKSKTSLIDIFKKYQDPETLAFDRTDIVVELSKIEDEILISRSQAKRITLGLEKFKHVTLDFSGIKLVGQGFVDELFRVYSNAHPEITFHYINANSDVEFMIKRGLTTGRINK